MSLRSYREINLPNNYCQLERAVRHLSDKKKLNLFSKEFCGANVVTYYNGLKRVTDDRWVEFMDAC